MITRPASKPQALQPAPAASAVPCAWQYDDQYVGKAYLPDPTERQEMDLRRYALLNGWK